MSGQQQSMFAEPEQNPSDQRANNPDPREQVSGETYPVYGEDIYEGRLSGAKIQPGRVIQRPRFPLVLLFVLLGVLLFGILGMSMGRMHPISGQQAQVSRLVYSHVISSPKVIIQDNSGDINIHSEGSVQDTVQVRSTDGSKNGITYRLDGNTLLVSVNDSAFLASSTPDLEVTLPQNSDVQIDTSSGSVSLSDITGNTQIHTDSGSIDAQNLSGQVGLHTTSGSIEARGLSGQATLDSNSGSIDVGGGSLNADSAITSDSGSISYNGSLSPDHAYHFNSSSGNIDLELPSDTSLDVQTQTSPDRVHNDFSKPTASLPAAHVTINSSSGDTTIRSDS